MKDWRRIRLVVSLAAVVVGVLICSYQRHFVIALDEPASFLLPFQHRCGLCLVGAIGWAMAEVGLSVGGLRKSVTPR